jgi:chromosomal replication initiator protein
LTDRDLYDCDLLGLEDVQHLTPRTANAACDLLDYRSARGRATVVTTSAGPAGLTHLPRRLTSRLTGGLVVHLEPLTSESRRVILADAATKTGVQLTPEALSYLVGHATRSLRAALGTLKNLAQIAPAFPGPLGRAEVESTLAQTGQPTSPGADVYGIVNHVAAAFGVTASELLGASRLRGVLQPRQVAMYLARELTGLSLPRLGAAFGGRDHTTILYAHRKVQKDLKSDPGLANQVRQLRAGWE